MQQYLPLGNIQKEAVSNLALGLFSIYQYQFGCGILKMVGPKKQDFWPKIYILKGNHCILRIRGAPVMSIRLWNFKDGGS